MTSFAMKDYFGLQVLWPKAGQTLTKVEHDIVFVHGLHSGSISDWREEEAPFWPVEFLGQDLKNTRILSFGYQTNKSTLTPENPCEEGRVFSHGQDLCSDLKDDRKLLKGDPTITFIGHGAGGIIIKSVRVSQSTRIFERRI
ncbi:hypothetical protein HDK90DRAFT_488969 [Phyllosticta capitalensis]|uniref:Uncharacterized protein n=1 Tax=Phyllosticta capitalensis TaxID=121624 RepID=A0ABR1YJT3_9PEZI